MFDDAQLSAVAQARDLHGGYGQWCGVGERRRAGAIEAALRWQGKRCGKQRGKKRGSRGVRGATEGVDHRATLWVAASSLRPCGTTLSVTRPAPKYWCATRWTSAAVTAR